MKPETLDEMSGTSVSVMKVNTRVSVAETSTILVLHWRKHLDFNGCAPSNYLIEYWKLPRIQEEYKIKLLSSSQMVFGTFALTFANTTTNSLNVDMVGLEIKDTLKRLPTMRSVDVERSGSNPNCIWLMIFSMIVHPFWGNSKNGQFSVCR